MTHQQSNERGISPRVWVGLAIAAVVVAFVAVNREDTEVSFILFRATTSLWMALALAAGGGFLAGFLISRRRYK